jgi:hypothetical protein
MKLGLNLVKRPVIAMQNNAGINTSPCSPLPCHTSKVQLSSPPKEMRPIPVPHANEKKEVTKDGMLVKCTTEA